MAIDLSTIKIGFSSLSCELFIYRHGKDSQLALDKREAQADVMAAVVEYMMHDSPEGASQIVRFGEKAFEIQVKPVENGQRKRKGKS